MRAPESERIRKPESTRFVAFEPNNAESNLVDRLTGFRVATMARAQSPTAPESPAPGQVIKPSLLPGIGEPAARSARSMAFLPTSPDRRSRRRSSEELWPDAVDFRRAVGRRKLHHRWSHSPPPSPRQRPVSASAEAARVPRHRTTQPPSRHRPAQPAQPTAARTDPARPRSMPNSRFSSIPTGS